MWRFNISPCKSNLKTPISSRKPALQKPVKLMSSLEAQKQVADFPKLVSYFPFTTCPWYSSPLGYLMTPYPVRISAYYVELANCIDPLYINLFQTFTIAYCQPFKSYISRTNYLTLLLFDDLILYNFPLLSDPLSQQPTISCQSIQMKERVPKPLAYASQMSPKQQPLEKTMHPLYDILAGLLLLWMVKESYDCSMSVLKINLIYFAINYAKCQEGLLEQGTTRTSTSPILSLAFSRFFISSLSRSPLLFSNYQYLQSFSESLLAILSISTNPLPYSSSPHYPHKVLPILPIQIYLNNY